MQAFDYVAAQNVEQVISLLSQHGAQARILNGGTDLIVQLRTGTRQAGLLVDIKRIPELAQLSYDPAQGLTIGAAASCWKLCSYPEAINHYAGLVEAVELIGGVQIQGRATLGGNLCNASPAADSIPALIVHQAVCQIAGPQVPLGEGIAAQQLHPQQRRMTLVHVIFAHLETQRLQHAHTADTEYHFLFEPIDLITAVKIMGELPIFGGVFVQVRVQQDHRLAAGTFALHDI